ncbi:MAG: hypothetical protein V4654_02550 [Bdellovibrionota bacterium]
MRFLIFICGIILGVSSQASTVTITAKYREAANIFTIMDCASGWWDKSFCYDDGQIQEEFKTRFGISDQDKTLFKKYDELRKKYYRGLGAPKEDTGPYSDGIFAKKSGIKEDLIAPAFYSSDKLDEALLKLKSVLSADDLDFLKSFYITFEPKYKTFLEESVPFKAAAAKLNKILSDKRFQKFYAKILDYYSVSEDLNYVVLFTWFPPLDHDSASPSDQFLILQKNPKKHIDWTDDDVVFHEIVHTVSARQPLKQKEDISKVFLKYCPIENKFGKYKNTKALEEPMAVVIGQILFLKEFFPNRVRIDTKLYNDPWVSSFSKIIYPTIENDFKNNKKFSENTGEALGRLCEESFKAAKIIMKEN